MTAEQKDILRIAAARMLEAIRYYKKYQPRPGTHGDGNRRLLGSAQTLIHHVMGASKPQWTDRLCDWWNNPEQIAACRKQLLAIINQP